MTDVTAIVTLHREGVLCGPSISSLEEAVNEARQAGLGVSVLGILDCCDESTKLQAARIEDFGGRVVETSVGDPALARNLGATTADGRWITYLDGDDLWSANWLTQSYQLVKESDRNEILHCEAIVFYGQERSLWLHPDSDDPKLDLNYLYLSNYWDAMSFGPRRAYLEFPYRQSQLSIGFGMEDWDWNRMTIAAGWRHRPVKGTLHMKRVRGGTQVRSARLADAVPFPLPRNSALRRSQGSFDSQPVAIS